MSLDDVVEIDKEEKGENEEVKEIKVREPGDEKPTEAVNTISEAAKALADRLMFISETTSNPKKARKTGYDAGSDLAIIKHSMERVLHGKATIDEALSLASNVSGLLEGFFHTANAFAEAEKAIREARKKLMRGKKVNDKSDR